MEIRTNVHTVFILVGATESGKTTFAKEVLIPQLRYSDEEKGFVANVQYISSDDIRRQLLGYDYDKHDQIMLESSAQAFNLLYERLKAVTSFPINAEFVIVDTIGLSEEFRDEVMRISRDHQYHCEVIVFDYKNREEFYATNRSKKIISQHLIRLRREVLKQILQAKYNRVHKIRERDFYDPVSQLPNPKYKVIVEDIEQYLESILPRQYNYIIIGDVHERVEDLKKLLLNHGFEINENHIVPNQKTEKYRVILVGDWIDKGGNTREIINFLFLNREWFYLVKGNHENFVSKYLLGEITKNSIEPTLLEDYFDSIKVLENDEELQTTFHDLVNRSREFYKFIGQQKPSFYVTHAPCKNKFLGKIDSYSLREQRNFYLDRTKPFEEQLLFLEEEAVRNHPFHVFGHVAVAQMTRLKNKMNIDTGCVHGNMLSSVTIESSKPFFK